ncbi:MAG: hypothetical protein CL811_06465 [Colwelliaceae bacterium]|nr:hypothetical protein [Colwelliaceae bacterium]
MKKIIQILFLVVFTTNASAGLIEADFSFDGTNLTQETGENIFNIDFKIGDTLRLTFTAQGEGSYWDFSNEKTRSFDAFDLGFVDEGYRGIDGYYYFYFEDALLTKSYYYITETGNRGGPYSLSVRNINFVDEFSIDYRFLDADADTNYLAPFETFSANWSIWDTFGSADGRVPFLNGQATAVSEPTTFAFVLLSMFGLIAFKARRK